MSDLNTVLVTSDELSDTIEVSTLSGNYIGEMKRRDFTFWLQGYAGGGDGAIVIWKTV